MHGNTKHGMYGSATYRSWAAMLNRSRAAGPGYAEPVSVCDRWRSFGLFLKDMGERPEGTTLDRLDGTKGYGPGNCRWATAQEQAENRKSVRWYEHAGKKQTIAAWARELGMSKSTLHRRLVDYGRPFAEAIK